MSSTKPSPRLLSLLNGKTTPCKSMYDEEEYINFPKNPLLNNLPYFGSSAKKPQESLLDKITPDKLKLGDS